MRYAVVLDTLAAGVTSPSVIRVDVQRTFEELIATRDPAGAAGDRPSPDAFPDVERVLHMLNAVRAQVLSGQPLLPAAISERLGQSDIGSFEFGPGLLVDGLRAR